MRVMTILMTAVGLTVMPAGAAAWAAARAGIHYCRNIEAYTLIFNLEVKSAIVSLYSGTVV